MFRGDAPSPLRGGAAPATSPLPPPTFRVMRAAVITAPGGPEVLEVRDAPTPVPGEHEVLVRVRASALNRADVLQRMGRYPAPPGAPADIAGIEFAGEVAATGPRATRWREGDRVYGITGGGAHAEYLVVHERAIAEIPAALDWHAAGAIPEAFITAHDAMIVQAGLVAGETVLVHAVGSGVGLAAVQLAHAIGARVAGTSRTADKLVRAREYGLELGLLAGADLASFAESLRTFTNGRGVDVTLDLLGGAYLAASTQVAALRGRVMLIGTIAGSQATLDLRALLGKRLTLRGTVLRSRALAEKVAATEAFARDVNPGLASGALRPVIDTVVPLDAIAEAHRRMESNDSFGKVVIDCG